MTSPSLPGSTGERTSDGAGPGPGEVRVSDGASVRRGMGFAAGSFVVNSVVTLCSAVLTARVYGIEVIGEFALVCAPWLTLVQFSSVGEQVALSREIAVLPRRDTRAGALFLPVLAFSFLLTAVVAVPVLLLGTAALRGPVDQPELVAPAIVLALGYVLLENTAWNLDAVLAAHHAGRELFLARLLQVSSFLVLALALRSVTTSVWGLMWATVASFGLALLLRLAVISPYLTVRVGIADLRAGTSRLPSVLGFALRLVPGRFAAGITNQAGTWVLGAFGTTVAVGAFSRASNLATRMNDAAYRVCEILFPALVQRHERGDVDGFERLLVRTLRPVTYGVLLIAAAGGGAAEGIMSVFGDGFGEAGPTLAILLAAGALWIVMTTIGQAVVAVARPGVAAILSTVRMVSTVACMVPATVAWGPEGVAVGLLVGVVATSAVQLVWLRRRAVRAAATRAILLQHGRGLLAGVPAFAAALAVDRALPGALGAAVALVAGSLAYLLALAALGGIDDDDRDLVRGLVARVRALRDDRTQDKSRAASKSSPTSGAARADAR